MEECDNKPLHYKGKPVDIAMLVDHISGLNTENEIEPSGKRAEAALLRSCALPFRRRNAYFYVSP